MVAVNTNTPYADITIQGLTFSYPKPYVAGDHALTEGEAHTLNQTLGENLRNNYAATIRRKIEEYRKANNLPEDQEIGADVLDKEELDSEFETLANEYEFGVRSGGGGTRAPADPVGKEAHKIALAKVKDALKKKNVDLTTVSKDQMSAWVKQALERYPTIVEEARRRVEAASSLAVEGLEL